MAVNDYRLSVVDIRLENKSLDYNCSGVSGNDGKHHFELSQSSPLLFLDEPLSCDSWYFLGVLAVAFVFIFETRHASDWLP